MHIRKLEDALGVKLFCRANKTLSLTAEGHELAGYAEKLLSLHSQAKSSIIGNQLRGKISFGIPDDYASAYLATILTDFSRQYPAVELSLICEPSSQLLPKIEAGTLDVALVTRDTPSRGQFLTRQPLVWVGKFPAQSMEDGPLPIAMYEFGSEARKRITQCLQQVRQGYRIMYNSPFIAGQIAVAQSGQALAILTQCSVPRELTVINSVDLPVLPVLELAVVNGDHCKAEHPANRLTEVIVKIFT